MKRGRIGGAVAVIGLVATAGAGLSGCTPDSARTVGSNSINGVRSDPDHQGLVVSYTGGGCDGPARLVLTESPTRIDADVVIGSNGFGSGACSAVGYFRTVGARLAAPIGERTVWSDGLQQVPFDGALLLSPTKLPPDFTGTWERGSADGSASSVNGANVTTTWVTRRFDASLTAIGGRCQPSRGSVDVRVAPVSADSARRRARIGTAAVGAAKARLYRDGSSKKPVALSYVWTVGRHSVEITTSATCTGDQILDRTELLAVAKSLRPA